ncbi:MAG: GNAT family N-acetyltransferase [Actinomycetota bacterium]|nr:GNAT family N-acetyltransferase [Actinomycetota bacterium]
MLRTSAVRVLGERDLAAALDVVDREPVNNVFVGSRLRAAGLDPWRLGGEVWGYGSGGRLESLCYAGANLVPVSAGRDAVRAFAERALRQGRRCSSIVGPAEAVLPLWDQLSGHWGPARDVRACQPLCVMEGAPRVVADPAVRVVRPDELGILVPACVAMFTEEVGVSPIGRDGGALYRSRVAELVAARRAFARIEDGEVVFKAEVGAVSGGVCQVQGVWVAPAWRGHRLSEAGMAAVVQLARATIAPVVSLYVNDYNTPARTAYARVGFREVGAFTSVLF